MTEDALRGGTIATRKKAAGELVVIAGSAFGPRGCGKRWWSRRPGISRERRWAELGRAGVHALAQT